MGEAVEHFGAGSAIPDAGSSTWIVDGLIGPEITAFTGQPFAGKTTVVSALVKLALRGDDWNGKPTGLPKGAKVLILCERGTDAGKLKPLVDECGDRVTIRKSSPWADLRADEFAQALRAMNVGLVVIDSLRVIAGDTNDQRVAAEILAKLRALPMPVVVIHHRPKYASGPAGAQAYVAEYSHIVEVVNRGKKDGSLNVAVSVQNSNICADEESFDLSIKLDTLEVGFMASRDESSASIPRRTKRKDVASPAEKAELLGQIAREQMIPEESSPGAWATAIVGRDSCPNQPARQQVLQRFGQRTGVSNKTIATIIRKHPSDFARGFGVREAEREEGRKLVS